jgi:Raf kinase inhibitor-like YbhB/YbcL family protein
MAMRIESPAFSEGGAIPRAYTCDGRDVSPALSWSEVPAGTKSLALICDDPDAPAGVWVHWVAYALPPGATGLPEGVPAAPELSGGGAQGKNDFGKLGYGGPCPPKGTHRYEFKLYAVDAEMKLRSGSTKAELLRAMHGHVLAEAKLIGTYTRR